MPSEDVELGNWKSLVAHMKWAGVALPRRTCSGSQVSLWFIKRKWSTYLVLTSFVNV